MCLYVTSNILVKIRNDCGSDPKECETPFVKIKVECRHIETK